MNLYLKFFTERDAKEVCSWQYDGQYSVYNISSWNQICKENWAMTIKEKREKQFNSVYDEFGELCGFIRLFDKDKYVQVGLGLKPSLCGKGIGPSLMELMIKECNSKYKNKKIMLDVRSFNNRAIKCYEKVGFKIVDKVINNNIQFIKMEKLFL